MKSFKTVIESVSQRELDDLEKFGDRLLNKFDIDIEFTRHFADRLNDKRNDPDIKVTELQRLFKKIAKNKGKGIKKHGDSEAVLKDMQSDLNLPVVINWKNGEFEVVNKTIMRKKGFKSPDPMLKYESVEEERNYRKEYDNYHKDPVQVKRRAKRNEARRSLRGRKDLTDDKDVHHKDNDPMNNDPSNLAIVTQHYNRREPRLRKEGTTVKTIHDIIKESGARRLTNRLKKGGVDLDKRAKERAASHAALVKKYASDKKEEVDEMKDDPCWKDHEMVGHKMKNGKKVPNCVPKEDVSLESTKEYGKSLSAIARKRQLAAMRPGEMDKLNRLKDMLKKSNKKESVKEAYQQFLDKTPREWGEEKVVAYGTKKGHKVIGVCGHGRVEGIVLFDLDSGDKKYIGKEAKVQSGQTVFRYATRNSMAGDIFPLVKIDIKKGLLYNLSQKSSEGEIEHAEFDSKSVKLRYLRFAATANLNGITGFDPGFGSMKEARSIKIAKGDKTRTVNKQELSTYKQMGWKVVAESVDLDEETFYIDFLNKKKGFKQDRIKFKSHDAAVKWAKKNFDKFNSDMIKTESVNLKDERDFFAIREATKKN